MSTLSPVGPVMPHSVSTHFSTLSIGRGWSWPQKGAFQINHTPVITIMKEKQDLTPRYPLKLLKALVVQFAGDQGRLTLIPYTLSLASLQLWPAPL